MDCGERMPKNVTGDSIMHLNKKIMLAPDSDWGFQKAGQSKRQAYEASPNVRPAQSHCRMEIALVNVQLQITIVD